jgi:hypothetical protein
MPESPRRSGPRSAARLALLALASLSLPPSPLGAQEEATFSAAEARSHLQSTARAGGYWLASNEEYWTAESGEPRAYAIAWTPIGTGFAATGCMWGVDGETVSGPYWHFFSAWDPTRDAILAYQVAPRGAVAIGHITPRTDGIEGVEILQDLVYPAGASIEVRHLERTTRDTREDESFQRDDDGPWQAGRSYRWVWTEDAAPTPCR